MLAITRKENEYGYLIKALRSSLKWRQEHLVTGPTRADVQKQGRDMEFVGGWINRGPIGFSEITKDYFQWWETEPANLTK